MDLTYRPATPGDTELLYHWRREGETADWYGGPKTNRHTHNAWLLQRLGTTLVRVWIVEADGVPVGVVRLDSNDELSIEIAPEHRGKGYGPQAIRWACAQAEGRVKANIDASNIAARGAFLDAGFQERPDVKFYLWKP